MFSLTGMVVEDVAGNRLMRCELENDNFGDQSEIKVTADGDCTKIDRDVENNAQCVMTNKCLLKEMNITYIEI